LRESTAQNYSRCEANSWWRNATFVAILVTTAAVYFFHLGHASFGASEAYSALAALQPTATLVAAKALSLDPGKPVLYHLLLHWFASWFGAGEMSLRAFSVIFGLASVVLVYALALELFGPEVALAAMALWAFSPTAVLFARWARMYSMFIAFTLGHLLAMARLHRRATALRALAAGVLGAAMLYTHLGAVIILAAEIAMSFRDLRISGKSNQWLAVAIAVALFTPFLPVALAQSRALLFGHWLDWIGTRRGHSVFLRLLVAAAAAAGAGWLVLAKPSHRSQSEWLRWCAGPAILPIVAFASGSVLVRPMFHIRYVAPCLALLAIVLAAGLDPISRRGRNLGTVFIAGLFIALIPVLLTSHYEPWRDLAAEVQRTATSDEAVVFEAGFLADGLNLSRQTNDGFPAGFFRVPFDYYFRGANPRAAVPAADSMRARKLIADELDKAGGVWLVSGQTLREAMKEVPKTPDVDLVSRSDYRDVLLIHLKRTGAVVNQALAD